MSTILGLDIGTEFVKAVKNNDENGTKTYN